VTGAPIVERYDVGARADWDTLVAGARARHFMFERSYMEYHADRFEDASLLIGGRGSPDAVLPASRDGDEVVSHAGLTFGGLLSGPRVTVSATVAAIDAVAAALAAQGARRLVYKAVPHIYHVAPAEEDLFALHAAGARLVRRDVSAAIPPGDRPAYSEERGRAVRHGAAAALELVESDRVEEFMELVAVVLRARHDAQPVHSPAEMRLLADRFPGRIRLWTAAKDGEILAGVLVYETPRVAHAQYIAGGERGRELRAGDVLFDHLLTVYADKWFDFGTSNERGGELNPGLIRNKEGFGARAVVYDRYLLELGRR
jgi:hypothetical protein